MTEEQSDHPDINKNIHPPIVTLFYILIAMLLGRFVQVPVAVPDVLQKIGFVLILIGFLFGLSAIIEFRKAHTTLDPHGSVSSVASSGVYRITRNPIYLCFLFIIIGFPLNFGNFWGLILSPLFIITMNNLVIKNEETYLEKKFKEQYTGYKSHVRRWL